LLITHEMAVVREVADQVVVLEAGRIIEQGSVAQVFAHPEHPTTRRFLLGETGTELPAALADRLSADPVAGGSTLIRLHAVGALAASPLLSDLGAAGIDARLIAGRIQPLGDQPFAGLIAALSGNDAAIGTAIHQLRAQGAEIEVLGHVATDAVAAG
jgi:D-methionine transport system ATP-binding protein